MKSSVIKLRKFRTADFDYVMEIEKSSFSPSDAYPKRRMERLCKKYKNGFIVAEKNEKIVGYILAYQKGNFIDFYSIAVDKNYRNLGIGTTLVNFMLKQFKKAGLKKASLLVKTTNKTALFFYKKLGFKIKKTIKKYYRDRGSAYRMEKIL